MDIRELEQRMHAVLDGEASAEEARELDRLLAADGAARDRFDELKRLFRHLSRVPQQQPPPGFASSVMRKVVLPAPGAGTGRQLFSFSRVRREATNRSRGRHPGHPASAHRRSGQVQH